MRSFRHVAPFSRRKKMRTETHSHSASRTLLALDAELTELNDKLAGLLHFQTLIDSNVHFTDIERDTVADACNRYSREKKERTEDMHRRIHLYERDVMKVSLAIGERESVIADPQVAALLGDESKVMDAVVSAHANLTEKLVDANQKLSLP